MANNNVRQEISALDVVSVMGTMLGIMTYDKVITKDDLENYANQWLDKLLEKNYIVESEQVFKDSINKREIYHIDYDGSFILICLIL